MAGFNERFPAEPSTSSQLMTGLVNGAKAKLAQGQWAAGGMNGPPPPMYTGGPSYPLQAQDLRNSQIAREHQPPAMDPRLAQAAQLAKQGLISPQQYEQLLARFQGGNDISGEVFPGGLADPHRNPAADQ
jgi:hypothetical protein